MIHLKIGSSMIPSNHIPCHTGVHPHVCHGDRGDVQGVGVARVLGGLDQHLRAILHLVVPADSGHHAREVNLQKYT